jgi:hypothetical protein
MWDNVTLPTPEKYTWHALDWVQRFLFAPDVVRRARDGVFAAEAVATEITQFRTIPQSPPYHAEGVMVIDHVHRLLQAIEAIVAGARLLQIEELARERDLHDAIIEIEEIIRENAATLSAFAVLHDLAKAQTLSFSAPEGSQGAAEGFATERLSSDQLAIQYGKLVRRHELQLTDTQPWNVAIDFYKSYQIQVHYDGHAKAGVSEEYEEARTAVEDLYRLTARDRGLLRYLIRYHIDVLELFTGGVNPAKYEALMARASKQGFDADDVLDLQAAVLLLDACLGSLRYDDGQLVISFAPFLAMLRSEPEAAPARTARREERKRKAEKKTFRRLLTDHELDAETVIETLQLPIGKERGDVIQAIHAAVKTGTAISQDLPGEMVKRIHRAHTLYQSQQAR